jgi:hypothetical protein
MVCGKAVPLRREALSISAYLIAGLYARVLLLARAQDQRQRACKALAAARASGPEGDAKVSGLTCSRCAKAVLRSGCAREHPTMPNGMFWRWVCSSYGVVHCEQCCLGMLVS